MGPQLVSRGRGRRPSPASWSVRSYIRYPGPQTEFEPPLLPDQSTVQRSYFTFTHSDTYSRRQTSLRSHARTHIVRCYACILCIQCSLYYEVCAECYMYTRRVDSWIRYDRSCVAFHRCAILKAIMSKGEKTNETQKALRWILGGCPHGGPNYADAGAKPFFEAFKHVFAQDKLAIAGGQLTILFNLSGSFTLAEEPLKIMLKTPFASKKIATQLPAFFEGIHRNLTPQVSEDDLLSLVRLEAYKEGQDQAEKGE